MITSERKTRFLKVPFILNASTFVLGGFLFFEEGKILYGVLQIFTGLLNVSLILSKTNNSFRWWVNVLVYIFNVFVAITIALDFISSGKEYIQYVWILTAIVSFIALIIFLRNNKRA